MPIPKELALTPDEMDHILSTSWNMRIGSNGPGERLHLTPLWFGGAGGRIYTFCRGQNVVNLRRNPTATVLVDRNEKFPELQGIMLQGRVQILEDEAAEGADPHLEAARRQMGEKYGMGDEGNRRHAATAVGRTRRWVVLEPDRTVTWDNFKLDRVRRG